MAIQVHDISISTQHTPERIERKFYLSPEKFDLAYNLLKHICQWDKEFPSEQINSLYFDTADLEQHNRSLAGEYRKQKVRIRWYGKTENLVGMQTVFLELKSRQGFTSTKQRRQLQVPAETLNIYHLCKGIISYILLQDTLAGFGFFPDKPLQPIIKIAYWRHRFNEVFSGQRVALDSGIRSTMVMPGMGYGEKELQIPGAVIEIKSNSLEIPHALKQIKLLDIDWSRFSKYSTCIDLHAENPGKFGRFSPSGKN